VAKEEYVQFITPANDPKRIATETKACPPPAHGSISGSKLIQAPQKTSPLSTAGVIENLILHGWVDFTVDHRQLNLLVQISIQQLRVIVLQTSSP
jgi:hypothetical protein